MSVPYTTRLSYACPDIGGQLIFCVISNYLLYFYTDVYGIGVGIAGTILLIARCIDGIDALVWGIVLDKTHSRWGKSQFTYRLGRKDLVPLVNSLDTVSLLAVIFVPWLCRFTSKRNLWALGLAGSVAGQVAMYLGQRSIAAVMAGWIFATMMGGVARHFV